MNLKELVQERNKLRPLKTLPSLLPFMESMSENESKRVWQLFTGSNVSEIDERKNEKNYFCRMYQPVRVSSSTFSSVGLVIRLTTIMEMTASTNA